MQEHKRTSPQECLDSKWKTFTYSQKQTILSTQYHFAPTLYYAKTFIKYHDFCFRLTVLETREAGNWPIGHSQGDDLSNVQSPSGNEKIWEKREGERLACPLSTYYALLILSLFFLPRVVWIWAEHRKLKKKTSIFGKGPCRNERSTKCLLDMGSGWGIRTISIKYVLRQHQKVELHIF